MTRCAIRISGLGHRPVQGSLRRRSAIMTSYLGAFSAVVSSANSAVPRRRPYSANSRVARLSRGKCPEITLMAAVRDRVRRANGSITTNGLQLGQQLETAKEQFATYGTRRGIDENKCNQLLRNRQTFRRRSARVLLDQRLLRDEARARRHLRLRARIQSLPQMPIPAPVTGNVSGGQVSQNITNSGTGRTDGLRAPLRRTACTDRRKIAFSSTEGTMYQCLLGSITENAPRKVTGPRHGLAMANFHQRWVTPQKIRKKLQAPSAT